MIYFYKNDQKNDISPQFQKKDAAKVLPLSDDELKGIASGALTPEQQEALKQLLAQDVLV